MNYIDLDDSDIPRGIHFKALIGLLEDALKEIEELKNEIVNLNHPHPIMTKEEVAELLGVSLRTVSNLVNQGELTPYYLGERLVRFKREEVLKSLKRLGNLFDPKKERFY